MHKCWPRGFLRQERAGISLLWLTGRYLLVEGLYYIARRAALFTTEIFISFQPAYTHISYLPVVVILLYLMGSYNNHNRKRKQNG